MTDTDDLSPTQYLILEVLAARHRTGERLWTFPTTVGSALRALEAAGLVSVMHGITEKSLRAGLTDAGQEACLSLIYSPPVPSLREVVESFPRTSEEVFAWLREHNIHLTAGVGVILSAVRTDLRQAAGMGGGGLDG